MSCENVSVEPGLIVRGKHALRAEQPALSLAEESAAGAGMGEDLAQTLVNAGFLCDLGLLELIAAVPGHAQPGWLMQKALCQRAEAADHLRAFIDRAAQIQMDDVRLPGIVLKFPHHGLAGLIAELLMDPFQGIAFPVFPDLMLVAPFSFHVPIWCG